MYYAYEASPAPLPIRPVRPCIGEGNSSVYVGRDNEGTIRYVGRTDKRYGLDLDGEWNKELLPHIGRHPNMYHDFVLGNMQEISKIANGNQNLFLNLFEQRVKQPIRNNPDMLYKKWWFNHNF